jgi:hypothetical protein
LKVDKEPLTPRMIVASHPEPSVTPRENSLHASSKKLPHFASLVRLTSASTPEEARSAVEAARYELLKYPDGSVAAAALLNFLEQGYDASLGVSMLVGAEGELQNSPTTRVALLDLLGQIDSELAAEYSRQLLQSSSSSDEWAIALRNYAWGVDNSAADPFLRAKVLELLTNPSWVADPTAGFLEAFDFVPYTHDPSLVAPLVNLTKHRQSSSVRRAAFLALERFVSQETTLGLQAVTEAEEMHSYSPIRADTMARADLTRPADSQIVREYLLSSQIDPKEFQLFASIFPHGGQFAGHSLATSFQPKSLADLARRDARALSAVGNWMSDPAFADRRQDLTQIYERLVRLQESATRGGYL